jgi:hypothetical protein
VTPRHVSKSLAFVVAIASVLVGIASPATADHHEEDDEEDLGGCDEPNPDDCDITLGDQNMLNPGPAPESEPASSPQPDGGGDGDGDGDGGSDEPPEAPQPEQGECLDPAPFPSTSGGQYEILSEQAGERENDDDVLWAEYCGLYHVGTAIPTMWMNPEWRPAAETDEAAVEQALLTDVYAQITGNLPDPVVSTNPGEGQASIVNVPTFISVTNWPSSGEITQEEGDCDTDGAVCVIVTAEPHLVFVPGEPESTPKDCQGPGEPYDPGLWEDDPYVQAAWDETCTHTYRLRTGVDDRPEVWDAEVEIHWAITGYRGTTGVTEDLEPVVTSEPVPLEVNPINAVVTD